MMFKFQQNLPTHNPNYRVDNVFFTALVVYKYNLLI